MVLLHSDDASFRKPVDEGELPILLGQISIVDLLHLLPYTPLVTTAPAVDPSLISSVLIQFSIVLPLPGDLSLLLLLRLLLPLLRC